MGNVTIDELDKLTSFSEDNLFVLYNPLIDSSIKTYKITGQDFVNSILNTSSTVSSGDDLKVVFINSNNQEQKGYISLAGLKEFLNNDFPDDNKFVLKQTLFDYNTGENIITYDFNNQDYLKYGKYYYDQPGQEDSFLNGPATLLSPFTMDVQLMIPQKDGENGIIRQTVRDNSSYGYSIRDIEFHTNEADESKEYIFKNWHTMNIINNS